MQLDAADDTVEPDAIQIRPASDISVVLAAKDWDIDTAPVNSVRSNIVTQLGGGTLTGNPQEDGSTRILEDVYEMRVIVQNTAESVVTGQRAYLRIRVGHEPLLKQGWRKLLQVVQAQSTTQAQQK